MSSSSPYPPPPWELRGPVVGAAAPIPLRVARSLVPAPLRVTPVLPGRALGMVLLGDYREGSTLRYGELAALVWPVRGPGGLGAWVAAMVVDDERSLAGGREIWGVPKQLGRFRWRDGRPGEAEVRDRHGALLVRARWRAPRLAVPAPATLRFFGTDAGAPRRGELRARGRAAPARVSLEIPPDSELAKLRLGRPRIGFAGTMALEAAAPTA